MRIDHVHFYVDNARKWCDWFVRVLGFTAIARSQSELTQTEVVAAGGRSPIAFLISSPLVPQSPVAEFLARHPPGVADVALRVADCPTVWQRSLAAGARKIRPLQVWKSGVGTVRWATLLAEGGLTHTLIERQGTTPWLPDRPWQVRARSPSSLYLAIDHAVLNLPIASFAGAIDWYRKVWGFEPQQQFAIETERSGLFSQVLIHPDSGLQLPINAPKGDRSQIQEFLTLNRGAGVQHVALLVSDIISAVRELRRRGLSFLGVPDGYYSSLPAPAREALSREEWQAIQSLKVLVDCEENRDLPGRRSDDRPLLLQIFSQPIFAEPTFFFELIERRSRARGFGEGNFQALFEAIEGQQVRRDRQSSCQ
jgi:4-hydroxyphenylpyruvate dioxygenase